MRVMITFAQHRAHLDLALFPVVFVQVARSIAWLGVRVFLLEF